MMDGNRKARDTNNKDEIEGVGGRVFFYINQYSQSSVDVLELRTMDEDEKARGINNGDKFKSIGRGVFFYINQYG